MQESDTMGNIKLPVAEMPKKKLWGRTAKADMPKEEPKTPEPPVNETQSKDREIRTTIEYHEAFIKWREHFGNHLVQGWEQFDKEKIIGFLEVYKGLLLEDLMRQQPDEP